MALMATPRLLFLMFFVLRVTTVLPTAALDPSALVTSPNSSHGTILPRQCVKNAQGTYDCDNVMPDLDQIRSRMQDFKDEGMATFWNVAAFYTAWGPDTQKFYAQLLTEAKMWLNRNCFTEYGAWNALSLTWHNTQLEHMANNAADMNVANAVWKTARYYWQGLAVAALNPDVFLFVPEGSTWAETSAWEEYEFWALTWNPYVERIWRIDPRGASSGKKLIWVKDNMVAMTQNIETGKRPAKQFCVK